MKATASDRSPRLVAMDALARREHSRQELLARLEARFDLAREELCQVLDDLESDGLLSDRRFAESFARYRLGRGQGKMRIRHDLRARGVSSELVDAALDGLAVDWGEQAREVLTRRFGSEPPGDYRERARRMRFLQQRGFSGDDIRAAVDARGDRD